MKGCRRGLKYCMCWPILCSHTHRTTSAILMRGPNPLLTFLNHWFTLSAHIHTHTLSLLCSREVLIVLNPPPHFDVKGSSGGSLLVPRERRRAEYSVSGTSGRAPLSRAYLAGSWYWHQQPSYRGPFISVWTCGHGPNPGRSRRALRQLRGWGVVALRRNPALLLSSGAPLSIPSSLPRLLIHEQLSPAPDMLFKARASICSKHIQLVH